MEVVMKPHNEIELEPTRPHLVPWLVALASVAAAAGIYELGYRPKGEELRRKTAALADLRTAKQEAGVLKDSLQETRGALLRTRQALAQASAQQAESLELVHRIQQALAQSGVEVSGGEGRITVTLVERILFDSGQAEVNERGKAVLANLGGVLKTVEDRLIQVSGHTDDVPISPELQARFPSNWELSTARATHVVRFLQDEAGVNPRQLMAAGFASNRPVASNATEKGRERNRRIEVILIPEQFKVVREKLPPPPTPAAPPGAPPRAAAR
jgi:chemotaxis protein MotB